MTSIDCALDQFAASLSCSDLRWAMLDLAGSAMIRACGPYGDELPRQRLIMLLSQAVIHAHAALGNLDQTRNDGALAQLWASAEFAALKLVLDDLVTEVARRDA